jgi:biopolymer transport protein ExbD
MQPLKAAPVRSDINVTPLVDVVLVLLIIFMVITPMLSKGPSVKLPKAMEPPKKPDTQDQLLVTVSADDSLWVENTITAPDMLSQSLNERFRENPTRTVVIKGDAQCKYGAVKRAMVAVKDAGFPGVGLIVEKAPRIGG